MTPFLLLFAVTLTAALVKEHQGDLVVQTVQGKLRGSILKTYTGKDVLSFRGVKYAEAPSGPNRFKPPIPVKPWEGIRNATEDGQLCPQPYFDNTAEDPEDCLLLNVYTKTLEGNQSVMVFFHHGGFLTGTGFSRILGPRYLLDKDIVLVTLNYRLGALGFLTTLDSTFPSNNGMKDQVTALQWVKQNIASFGGNPDAVTIFGNSAGSASVMFHMLSPLSQGLFVRGIAMSGSVLGGWAINRHPRSLAHRLGNLLGCSSRSSLQLYNCLKDVPAQNIANATIGIKDFGLDAFSIFAPVIEDNCHHSEDCFLPEDPVELIRNNKNTLVPLMTGITTDEISYRAEILLKRPELTEQFDKEFDHYAPVEFQYTRKGPDSKNISHELRKFYFGNKTINNDTEDELGMAYADAHLIYSGIESAKLIANLSRNPVYFYLFDYSGRYSSRFYPGARVKPGVLHSDDLIYLFSNTLFLPAFNTTDPEAKVISLMTTLWTNFANTGNPNSNTITSGVEWEPLDKNSDECNFKYLRITDKLEVNKCSPFPARMALWKTLLPVRERSSQIFF